MADYVIVGGGSAGCVLAGRLSEDPDASVVVLEAGPPDVAYEIHVPFAFPALFKSSHDWDLLGEKEPGLGGRRLYLPRGKMIGGCGSINAMIYLRGHRADFDGWAADGATGWSYDEVLPYFKRAEDNERGEDEFHGVGGPLSVSESRSMQPLVDAMLEAAVQAGYERIPDLNVDRPLGVSRFQVTQRNGKRCSTADAYLHPAAGRPNLEVRTSVLATKIVFEGNRAVGVETVKDGKVETVRAEREVILAAGAYQSPVLLMLSGIGPEEDLALFGIPVRENLPVGRNLQDHCMANVNFTTETACLFGILTPENFELLEREGRGPLSSNIPEAGGFFKSRDDLDAPDIEFHFAPSIFFDEGLNAPTDPGYAFGPVLINPNARGWVKLRTPMPDSKPLVLCNFLTDEQDRRAVVAGVRIALEIASQPALKSVELAPFSVPDSDSDADILAWVERNAQTVYHPTSTCAIGPVVDPELRVHGVEGLRVCDASVMPTITRGNTHAATVMIGEKGADLISGKAPLAAAQAYEARPAA
jgi:choline dehydrogenase-like flavoprotein